MRIEDLKRLRTMRQEIESKRERIARLRSQMERMTQMLSLAPGGGLAQTIEDQMAEYLALEEELTSAILALEYDINCAEAAIDQLPGSEALILRLRYVDCLPWGKVAKETHYCRQQCFRLHRQAIDRLNGE